MGLGMMLGMGLGMGLGMVLGMGLGMGPCRYSNRNVKCPTVAQLCTQ